MNQLFELSADDAKQWAHILDDENPLHADAGALESHGLGRGIVNPGPANMGYLMTLVLQIYPSAVLEEFAARFTGVVIAPAIVEAHLHVVREESTPAGMRLYCELELRCQEQVAVRAKARLHIAHVDRSEPL